MPMIEVSDTTNARLLSLIESFDDNADSIITGLLDKANVPRVDSSDTPDPAPERELLPETRYWVPILRILDLAGGQARGSEVIDALGPLIEGDFSDADREMVSSGEPRWRNRARFARLRLKELGYIARDSPRGIWAITDAGRDFLAQRRAAGET
jgi:hypothetical protein